MCICDIYTYYNIYIRDLNNHKCGYSQSSWNQSPVDTNFRKTLLGNIVRLHTKEKRRMKEMVDEPSRTC